MFNRNNVSALMRSTRGISISVTGVVGVGAILFVAAVGIFILLAAVKSMA